MVFSLVGVVAAATWRDVGLLAAVTMPFLACWNAFVNHVQQPHQAPSSPASCDAGVYSGFAHRYDLDAAFAELKKDAQDALDAERRSVPAHCPTSGPDGGGAVPPPPPRRRRLVPAYAFFNFGPNAPLPRITHLPTGSG